MRVNADVETETTYAWFNMKRIALVLAGLAACSGNGSVQADPDAKTIDAHIAPTGAFFYCAEVLLTEKLFITTCFRDRDRCDNEAAAIEFGACVPMTKAWCPNLGDTCAFDPKMCAELGAGCTHVAP